MTNIAIIPARSGSKRIPNKNIKNFLGKPIINWSINAAKSSKIFDEVIVSTDSKEIAELASKLGASTPFIRPNELSDDFTGVFPVIKHAILELEKQGIFFKNVCCIYPTSALIKFPDLIKSFDFFKKSKKDFLMCVCEYSHPIERGLKLNENGQLNLIDNSKSNIRTQDLTPSYYDAGQFYWGSKEKWIKYNNIFEGRITPYILPFFKAVDIDQPHQWKIAELMFKYFND